MPLYPPPPHLIHGWSLGGLLVAAPVEDVSHVTVHGVRAVHVAKGKVGVGAAKQSLSDRLT